MSARPPHGNRPTLTGHPEAHPVRLAAPAAQQPGRTATTGRRGTGRADLARDDSPPPSARHTPAARAG
ncbi:hypothetical protein [Streptomyces parvus]|uniref:hypothetical protein n=1 Tax=Streptomyces parvus TaxID=66428 RepID=UPI00344FA9D5